MKYMKDLKQVMKYGVMLEYIPSNPFDNFQCSYKKVKRDFLDQEELDLLYKKEFRIKRLEEVRDCYVLSCYTGYAYSDAESLTTDDIAIGIDDKNGSFVIGLKLIQQKMFRYFLSHYTPSYHPLKASGEVD